MSRYRSAGNIAPEPREHDQMKNDRQKALTVRLDPNQHAELEAVARVDETTVSESIRTAVDEYIEAKRTDHEFRSRLKSHIEQNREILDRLAR